MASIDTSWLEVSSDLCPKVAGVAPEEIRTWLVQLHVFDHASAGGFLLEPFWKVEC
jgi:hypothetical protein